MLEFGLNKGFGVWVKDEVLGAQGGAQGLRALDPSAVFADSDVALRKCGRVTPHAAGISAGTNLTMQVPVCVCVPRHVYTYFYT